MERRYSKVKTANEKDDVKPRMASRRESESLKRKMSILGAN